VSTTAFLVAFVLVGALVYCVTTKGSKAEELGRVLFESGLLVSLLRFAFGLSVLTKP
jgi:hypothetical protein